MDGALTSLGRQAGLPRTPKLSESPRTIHFFSYFLHQHGCSRGNSFRGIAQDVKMDRRSCDRAIDKAAIAGLGQLDPAML